MIKLKSLLFLMIMFSSITGFSANNFSSGCQSNAWVKSLVAQTPPPLTSGGDIEYVKQIKDFAPDLTHLDLRITLKYVTHKPEYEALVDSYVQLINLLRDNYPAGLIIGFHPDNSKSSYGLWWNPEDGSSKTCEKGDWKCVFSNSIILMNAINSKLDPGQGFNEFSIEQSYVEPQDLASVKTQKSCLDGNSNGLCPLGIAHASPAVAYGYVGGSYSSKLYVQGGFDYAYPQFYNLQSFLTLKPGVPNPDFPLSSTYNKPLSPDVQYSVAGANMGAKPWAGEIIPSSVATNRMNNTIYAAGSPGFDKKGHPITIWNITSPTLAATYAGYLFSTKPPFVTQAFNDKIFIMLSGEDDFLGAHGWTAQKICEFHTQLISQLKNKYGINTDDIQFGIWNFDTILNNLY